MEVDIKCRYNELVALDKLKPNPANPNKHSDAQIARLAKIFEYQGIRHPIVVSRNSGLITKGHGRLAAAKLLGMKDFPVEYQEYDNAEQEYADLVADNAVSSWAELDLGMINAELPDFDPDFNIELLGIKDFVIDMSEKLIQEINKGDENSSWVDMPEFIKGNGYINLIYQFKNESDRELYVKNNNIKIDTKKSNQWIIYK